MWKQRQQMLTGIPKCFDSEGEWRNGGGTAFFFLFRVWFSREGELNLQWREETYSNKGLEKGSREWSESGVLEKSWSSVRAHVDSRVGKFGQAGAMRRR